MEDIMYRGGETNLCWTTGLACFWMLLKAWLNDSDPLKNLSKLGSNNDCGDGNDNTDNDDNDNSKANANDDTENIFALHLSVPSLGW